jgi:hypothetical protein
MTVAISAQAAVKPTRQRAAVTHAWLSSAAYQLLEQEAARRRVHPDRLAADILCIVIADDLFRIILPR